MSNNFKSPCGMTEAKFAWPSTPTYRDNIQKGFNNLDFFLTINKESPNYFWAHQFFFLEGNGGYMGLQSSALFKGEVTKIAIFSIWDSINAQPAKGGTAEQFDNEGNGYSCKIKFNWESEKQYRIRLGKFGIAGKLNENNWWGAWVLDTLTLKEEFIGKMQLPASWKCLTSNSVNFVEYWGLQDGQVHSCSEIPYTKATFTFPTLENGTVKPTNVKYQTYGDCSSIAKINKTISNGYEVETGL